MASKLVSFPSGIQSGATGGIGSAVVSTNQRARTAMGPLGLSTDVVIFAGGTGTWLFTNQRVRVSGTPTVSTTSVGQAVEFQQAGPMTVIMGDPRVAGI